MNDSADQDAQEQAEKAATKALQLDAKILIAEDGPDNQRLIAFILQNAGATIDLAENGQIAFDKVKAALSEQKTSQEPPETSYNLILMDMQMPVMDGYTATQKIRELGVTIPIIALTSHAMVGDREECIQAGCDDYLTKPVDKYKLIQLVYKYLQKTDS